MLQKLIKIAKFYLIHLDGAVKKKLQEASREKLSTFESQHWHSCSYFFSCPAFAYFALNFAERKTEKKTIESWERGERTKNLNIRWTYFAGQPKGGERMNASNEIEGKSYGQCHPLAGGQNSLSSHPLHPHIRFMSQIEKAEAGRKCEKVEGGKKRKTFFFQSRGRKRKLFCRLQTFFCLSLSLSLSLFFPIFISLSLSNLPRGYCPGACFFCTLRNA